MKILSGITLVALLSAPAWSADTVVTRQKHTDAMNMAGHESPAEDVTQVLWIAKDRARFEDGDKVTLLRMDQKKLYMLDTKAKSFTVLDLPVDMKKYIPAEAAPMMEQMLSGMKVVVTPTTDTRKIGDWNTTRYTVATSFPMGSVVQELWVTKDIASVDLTTWQSLSGALNSTNPFTSSMVEELKKVDGIPVLTERTQTMMGNEQKASEKVVSVEQKEPSATTYEVPEGYTEKPFDFMDSMGGGGRRGGMSPRGRTPGGH